MFFISELLKSERSPCSPYDLMMRHRFLSSSSGTGPFFIFSVSRLTRVGDAWVVFWLRPGSDSSFISLEGTTRDPTHSIWAVDRVSDNSCTSLWWTSKVPTHSSLRVGGALDDMANS